MRSRTKIVVVVLVPYFLDLGTPSRVGSGGELQGRVPVGGFTDRSREDREGRGEGRGGHPRDPSDQLATLSKAATSSLGESVSVLWEDSRDTDRGVGVGVSVGRDETG